MQQSFGIFEGLGVQEAVIILCILIALAFVIAMLFDLFARKKAGPIYKLIWALVIIFVPMVGAVIYYFSAFSRKN